MSKVYSVEDECFRTIVSESSSYSEVLIKLGLVPRGGTSSKLLKKRIDELGCSVAHFEVRGSWTPKQDMSEILVENSTYTNNRSLKARLIGEGYMAYVCSMCFNNGIWFGNRLALQLDHINGVNNDNRIENLRFLCPNCHSQTSTFAGRNKQTSATKP